MKSVAFHNLGCKVNSYELDVMRQYFQKNNYSIVDFAQKADIYIINTCTVTNIADRKSRQMIHKAKAQNPHAVVVAVGCYVQTHEKELAGEEGIDLAVGNDRKKDIVSLVEEYLALREAEAAGPGERGEKEEQEESALCEEKTLGGTSILDLTKPRPYEEMQLFKTAEHTRAYIKIQDGCDQFCSYCAIPYARGRVRSRKPENVLEEARGLAKSGYRELVLTGIHVSSYGLDFYHKKYNQVYEDDTYSHSGYLLSLIRELADIPGIDRIRLSSLEPRIITEEFAKELSGIPEVCPHFHLSLQSGCDSVLERMNRRYTCEDFRQSVACLRKYYEDPAVTTDIICGFPGETEEEFEETLRYVEGIGFYETHIFPYSRRKNTAADRMSGQLTQKVKKERCGRLLELNERQSAAYRKRFLDKSLPVLWEQEKQIKGESCLVGHTPNYLEVALLPEGEWPAIGTITDCLLSELMDEGLIRGKILLF
ncbi:MAG: tRNA (N(6)-L-threonylcarbamoyladenosine(37)-C(2))-methylthiotransferase MtaB [Lachnospiraceae bacterium]|nr:tRNA (N(6)-L-threonylcarbamoyladenosine(37)-C(2))-methylthiotransferase MtaB [Lachnospiraceae bacterium]